jgi:pSer/pThr/pTyr-binding forkhead associated (FHA) protein
MGVPQLVVIAPDSYRGHRIELTGENLTVGREPTCDVRFDDPHVSRTHAALQRHGDSVYVQDLGSSGGTFVNGNPATRTRLHHGDIVAFATVQARFEARPPVTVQTRAMPAYAGQVQTDLVQAVPPQAAPPLAPPRQAQPPLAPPRQAKPPQAAPPQAAPAPAGQVHYSIGQQDAQVISNVGRDQYNAQVQQVIQQRDSFLRDVAATKTKARWLVWLGLLLFLVGFALFGAADLDFIRQVSSDIQTGNTAPPSNILGHPIAGVPSGLIGAGLAFIGLIMLLIGILLHIVATSRRRRVERELPLPPPPWPQYGPRGRAG